MYLARLCHSNRMTCIMYCVFACNSMVLAGGLY